MLFMDYVATFISNCLFHFGATQCAQLRHFAHWVFCRLIFYILFLFKWGLGIQISVRVENSTLTTADAIELRVQFTTTATGRLCFTGEYIFIIFGFRALFFAFVAAVRWLVVLVGFIFLVSLLAHVSLGLFVGDFAYSASSRSLQFSTTASRAVPDVRLLGPTSP